VSQRSGSFWPFWPNTLCCGVGPGIAAIALSAGALISFVAEPHVPTFLAAALSVVAPLEVKRRADIKERQAQELFNTRLPVDSIPAMIDTMTATGDGSYRWLTTRGLPVFDRTGSIVPSYNLMMDIDERKRAEEALRVSELNFRMIVESIPGMVLTMTAGGELEFANRQILELLGKSLEELRDWPQHVRPEDRARVAALDRGAIETGQHVDAEYRMLRVDGVHPWLHCRGLPYLDADGQVMRWHMLLTDVENLKQAEESARDSELKFRLTIDNIAGMAS